MTRAHLALLSLVLLGCRVGGNPKNFEPAMSPKGASVAVRLRGETTDRVGELYAADSAGVLVRTPRLVRISWSALSAMDVKGLGDGFDVYPGRSPSAEQQKRLAAVSRFPQGLSGELLTRVLALVRQSQLDTVP